MCLPFILFFFFFFFFNDTPTTEIYTLSLHDALPISLFRECRDRPTRQTFDAQARRKKEHHCVPSRSEEHTSELQSLTNLVCRLLLEKKKKNKDNKTYKIIKKSEKTDNVLNLLLDHHT